MQAEADIPCFSETLATTPAAKRKSVFEVNIHLFADQYISHHNQYVLTPYSNLNGFYLSSP